MMWTIWLRSYEICQCRKALPAWLHHSLERQVVGAPNQRVALDILGPFEPVADSGNKHILMMTDFLTKWVEEGAMPDKTAKRYAAVFVNGWVLQLGSPEELLSDQGAHFESRLFQEMCKLLAVEASYYCLSPTM
jgi:hypothetical protein